MTLSLVRNIVFVSAAGASLALGGCYRASVPPPVLGPVIVELAPETDAPVPDTDPMIRVYFSDLFEGEEVSNSFFAQTGASLRRTTMMVGPSLVLEASRSSLSEALIGTPNAMMGSELSNPGQLFPEQNNALGNAIDLSASSALLGYLSRNGVGLVAPAFTSVWCDDRGTVLNESGNRVARCPEATWVERILLMAQDLRDELAMTRPRYDVPEYVMAVRTLGISSRTVYLSLQSVTGTEFRVRPSDEPSGICPGAQVRVPIVEFVAEVIRTDNGEIVARVDEQRPFRMTRTQAAGLNAPVRYFEYRALTAQAYRRTVDGQNREPYTYTSGWEEDYSGFCSRLVQSYIETADPVIQSATAATYVGAIIEEVLDPLVR